MSFKDLANKAKHLVVEDDPSPVKTAVAPRPVGAPVAIPNAPSFPMATSNPFAVPTPVQVDDSIYQKILAKTDFNNTDVGKVIHKYFDALDGTGLDTATRFKSAISQATKLDGITSDKILAAFDMVKAQLQQEVNAFTSFAKDNENVSITNRQNRMAEIDKQIASLNQEKLQISADLSKAQMDHTNAVQQFGIASQRRASEIDQQKAQFAAMLNR